MHKPGPQQIAAHSATARSRRLTSSKFGNILSSVADTKGNIGRQSFSVEQQEIPIQTQLRHLALPSGRN